MKIDIEPKWLWADLKIYSAKPGAGNRPKEVVFPLVDEPTKGTMATVATRRQQAIVDTLHERAKADDGRYGVYLVPHDAYHTTPDLMAQFEGVGFPWQSYSFQYGGAKGGVVQPGYKPVKTGLSLGLTNSIWVARFTTAEFRGAFEICR